MVVVVACCVSFSNTCREECTTHTARPLLVLLLACSAGLAALCRPVDEGASGGRGGGGCDGLLRVVLEDLL